MTGIVYTPGALFTCSTDNTIKVLEPSLNPGTINTITGHQGEVARVSYWYYLFPPSHSFPHCNSQGILHYYVSPSNEGRHIVLV